MAEAKLPSPRLSEAQRCGAACIGADKYSDWMAQPPPPPPPGMFEPECEKHRVCGCMASRTCAALSVQPLTEFSKVAFNLNYTLLLSVTDSERVTFLSFVHVTSSKSV